MLLGIEHIVGMPSLERRLESISEVSMEIVPTSTGCSLVQLGNGIDDCIEFFLPGLARSIGGNRRANHGLVGRKLPKPSRL